MIRTPLQHRRDGRVTLGSVTFVTFFILLLLLFNIIDVFDKYFFTHSITAPYNLLRAIYVIYLSGVVCVPGFAALSMIGGGAAFVRLRPLERLTAGFFCGASLWHALLLLLGFLNLYLYPVAVILVLGGVALTPIYLRDTVTELYQNARDTLLTGPRSIAYGRLILAAGILASGMLLLLVKGLYPAGGHDYFNHYNGYYDAVLRNHGIWPNDVWYQFYYCKGLGLFFLSMMVTDPLAPSLVTSCFVVAAAAALFLMVDRMAPDASLWPWIAVIAYFILYTFTPGIGVYLQNGGWADFQKPHEIGSAFVIGFIWLCAGLRSAAYQERRVWVTAAAASIFILSIIELASVFLLGLFTLVLMGVAALRHRSAEVRAYLLLGVVGGCGLVGIFVLNYVITGLPSDQFALEVWPWVNVRTMYKWGALSYLLFQMQGMAGMRAHAIPVLSWDFIDYFHDLLRLDLLKPLLISTTAFLLLLGTSMLWRLRRPQPEQDTTPLWLLLALLTVLVVATALAGRIQTISFYRYTSFCLPVVIGLAACGWLHIGASISQRRVGTIFRYVVPVVLLVATLHQYDKSYRTFLRQIVGNAAAFVDGSLSIEEAYSNQQGWPGRQQWGGIFPGVVGAWRVAGPGTRIWSMHLGAYCMLPHCRSETYFSFILSPRLLDLLVDSGDQVRDILEREGLNYFFFTTKMDLFDVLPLIKPFTPDDIGNYLGVKWTDGTSYLLTWLGPGVTRLTPEWIAQYKRAVATAPSAPNNFPLDLALKLREQMLGDLRWGRDLRLPGISGN